MQPTFSIIIPCPPGWNPKALGALAAAVYPSDRFEILVAEGRWPSLQRNRAVEACSGDVIYFLDDDSLPQSDFLARAARHFADPAVAAVGGPSLTPETDSPLQKAFAAALSSPLASGGAGARYRRAGAVRRASESDLILCNLAIRRAPFVEAGGFDERLYPNEENELLDRLQAKGWSFVYDPELSIERSQRRTLKAFIRQIFSYGRGRGEQIRVSKKAKPLHFVPSLFLLWVLAAVAAPGAITLGPLLGYVCLLLFFSLREGFSGGAGRIFRLLFLFPSLHLLYGFGLLRGVTGKVGRNPGAPVSLRVVKPFGSPLPEDHGASSR